jgi:hypothetical protein
MNGPLRLLPWPGEGGKASFLSPAGGDSCVSRLADGIEARQLDMAEDLLDHTREALERGGLAETEWRLLATTLSVALRDVLRIAGSRAGCLSRSGGNALGCGSRGFLTPAAG